MKTLFLIDGAYGDAKKALCKILLDDSLYRWTLIKKLTTKKYDDAHPLPADMRHIDDCDALKYFNQYKESNPTTRYADCRYYCYEYPRLDEEQNEEINCIDVRLIDEAEQKGYDYGFLIVRSHKCMMDLIRRYEKNGQINVVPVFIYSDDSYILQKDVKTQRKSRKLFEDFINDREGKEKINFEDVLIYKSNVDGTDPKAILLQQIKQLIERTSNKNEDMFVVTSEERFYLPNDIRKYKNILQKKLGANIAEFRKRMFLIMPFQEKYEHYNQSIKNKIRNVGYQCIRADDDIFEELGVAPDISYWLKMYMCNYGVAFFDSDANNMLIINANVVYEMGIMKQQGKKICFLIPEGARLNERDAEFFDIKNEWKYGYKKDDIYSIEQCIEKFINKISSI